MPGGRKGLTEADYARLLDAAHRQLGGPIVLVWDNLNTHVSAAMAEIVAARSWLTVFRLPPYAHELNPVEPVWSHLKRSLANLTKHDLAELTALVKTRLKRMQYRPRLLAGFLASTGLDLRASADRRDHGVPRGWSSGAGTRVTLAKVLTLREMWTARACRPIVHP